MAWRVYAMRFSIGRRARQLDTDGITIIIERTKCLSLCYVALVIAIGHEVVVVIVANRCRMFVPNCHLHCSLHTANFHFTLTTVICKTCTHHLPIICDFRETCLHCTHAFMWSWFASLWPMWCHLQLVCFMVLTVCKPFAACCNLRAAHLQLICRVLQAYKI